jgi:predicted amidohydrolase YtcJ
MMRFSASIAVLVLAVLLQSAAGPDILITNARVFTGDAARPWAESVAIAGSRITSVGASSELRRLAGPSTRVIDANGRLLIPGINDAHMHPRAAPAATRLPGAAAGTPDQTPADLLDQVGAATVKAPERGWILGEIGARALESPRVRRSTLDGVTGEHPLLLQSWTGHGVIVNTAALRALGIRDDEPDPPGGRFERGPDGRTLTGLAHEYAGYLIGRRLALLPGRAAERQAFATLAHECAAFGITSIQAMLTSYPTEVAAELLDSPDLSVRVRLIDFPMMEMAAWNGPASARVNPSSPLVTVSGTKWILDGTPVERHMWLRGPYQDAPATRGAPNFREEDLESFFRRAFAAGEQPLIHAVGDAAMATVLAGLERTGGENWKRYRPRIEHADMLRPEDVPRAARMGVTIVQNPSHFMIPDIMNRRLGAERTRQADRVRDVVSAGVPFALGSDGPLNPFLNIMFATMNPTNASQALTVEQALSAYTSGSAVAEFAENEKGTIRPGMLADVALLSQDIFRVPPPELPKTTSVLTIVNGRVVHQALER